MKVTRIGWAGKCDKVRIGEDLFDHILKIYPVLPTRGKKEDYFERNWPPRKIRITVEDVK